MIKIKRYNIEQIWDIHRLETDQPCILIIEAKNVQLDVMRKRCVGD
jgi:hypothetical protein